MECMAYIHHTAPTSISQHTVEGELMLHLKEPLQHKGTDDRYNVRFVCVIVYLFIYFQKIYSSDLFDINYGNVHYTRSEKMNVETYNF